ncbi:MAG: hypothetical protein NTU70_10295 [Methylococcales bacterium]|nr:hypothetical protein [Methylococcales bacterium]
MQKKRQDPDCPVFVIADNGRYHHSKEVHVFLKTQLDEIIISIQQKTDLVKSFFDYPIL